MRLIDADALIKVFSMLRFNEDRALRHWGDRPNWYMSRQEVEKLIASAPTIEQEQQWIPCSERLPEESGLYIVTNVGRWVEPVGTRYYNIRANGGFWSGNPGDKVIAWMPLPTPYRGEGEE